jgi:phosphoglycolate phosphatase/pyrophosphatase PpaX
LKHRCLVLDHDDTAVNSTPTVHYPAHVEVMKRLRPERNPIELEGWFLKNFDPGIMAYLVDELGFTQNELEEELRIWREFNNRGNPEFFPGFIEALEEYRQRGGAVAIVSHSETEIIQRHYESRNFLPDLILGWHDEHEKRKPYPWPLYKVMDELGFAPKDILVVDDLKPGILMAEKARVKSAGVGWAHHLPEIEAYMRKTCDVYLNSVAEFHLYIVGGAQ